MWYSQAMVHKGTEKDLNSIKKALENELSSWVEHNWGENNAKITNLKIYQNILPDHAGKISGEFKCEGDVHYDGHFTAIISHEPVSKSGKSIWIVVELSSVVEDSGSLSDRGY